MRKLLSPIIVAVALCGCASTHVKHSPAPIVAVASVDHTAELAAVRTPQVTPQAAPQVAPAVSSAKVAAKPAPIVVVGKSVESSVKPAKTSFLVGVFKWVFVTVFTALLSWASYKYLVPLVKKFLAWVKTKNVVKNLETFAKEAESKIEVDFKDVVADVEHKSPVATLPAVSSPKTVVPAPALPPSTTAHLAPVESVKK
jgi:hypothetical protein